MFWIIYLINKSINNLKHLFTPPYYYCRPLPLVGEALEKGAPLQRLGFIDTLVPLVETLLKEPDSFKRFDSDLEDKP